MNDTSHPVSIRLMCTDKQTMLNIIDNLRHIPNIMARSSDDDQCLLNLQMSRPSLHRTWSEVFVPVMLSQLSRLNALQLEGSFIVQLRKPQVEKTGDFFCLWLCVCIKFIELKKYDFIFNFFLWYGDYPHFYDYGFNQSVCLSLYVMYVCMYVCM